MGSSFGSSSRAGRPGHGDERGLGVGLTGRGMPLRVDWSIGVERLRGGAPVRVGTDPDALRRVPIPALGRS